MGVNRKTSEKLLTYKLGAFIMAPHTEMAPQVVTHPGTRTA